MFLQSYYNSFSKENFAENISLERFQKEDMFQIDFKTKGILKDKYGNKKHQFENITSVSGLRNVFDTYLKIYGNYENGKIEQFEIEKEILFARIAYQEQRGLLPKNDNYNKDSFTEFLRGIYKKLDDPKKFKQFLEVFVAYHKFFNPNAK